MTKRILNFGLCAVLTLVTFAAVGEASARRETPLVKAVQKAKTAVVNIHSEKTTYSSDTVFHSSKGRKVNGMGTGVVVDERGYIVTNHHVIDGVDTLRVTLVDGSNYMARVISYDRKHDLAIIKIDPTKELAVMPIGTSSDLMLGETVIAVGNAFGYEHTVTSGIISSLSRDVEVNETQSYYNLIQTDASINPGNSGGPLLNLDGEVVGINVAIRAGAQRIGFAIPIDQARQIIAELMSVSQIEHIRHGLVAEDIKTPDLRQLVVKGAEDESPAAKAGFKPGDVVLQVGEIEVQDRVDFERALLGKKPGDEVEVKVDRGGEQQTVKLGVDRFDANQVVRVNAPTVIRGNNEEETFSERVWRVIGAKLEKLEEDQTITQGTPYEGGLRVLSVRPGSPAARGGLQNGDVLVGLHRWRTETDDNVRYILDQPESTAAGAIRFYILRNRQPLHGELDIAAELARK